MRMDDFSLASYEVTLTLQEARRIADEYARTHFKGFKKAGLELTEKQLVDHGDGSAKFFSFTWIKKDAESGALLPVAVTVRVDPVSGDVFSYDSLDVPVKVSTSPKLDAKDAEAKALDAVGKDVPKPKVTGSTLAVSTDPPTDPAGKQALVWQVVVTGDDSKGYATGAYVYIDARSGEVLGVDPFA